MVNKERVALLIEELRNGGRKQGKGALLRIRNGEEEACCLGVACEVARANGLQIATVKDGTRGCDCELCTRTDVRREYDGEINHLPPSVQEWYGFFSKNPYARTSDGCEYTAVQMNDELEMPFSEIADAFERMYLSEDSD